MTSTKSYRLPREVAPEHYRLELIPDLEAARFEGAASISLRVDRPTSRLVLNAAELQLTEARVTWPDGSTAEGTVSLDEEEQRATIDVGRELPAGTGYTLDLAFTGILNDRLRGFYRSTFTAHDGTEQVIATTQMEPADARRAFPCWDEPDFKATFAVSLVVDDRLTAISNGDVVAEEAVPGGKRRVTFAETMPMSTYLVAFVVGPFELTPGEPVDGVPLRVAAVPGQAALTPFAITVGSHALRFLARYFDIPYPAGKIDHIAIPDFAFGAMENLGCVTYREMALLIDPDTASLPELKRVATVIAHETAHMWFGDLVTMRWWNGIWLNEAFATFMENTTIDAFNPDWQVWTGFGAGKAAAMAVDGLQNTRPVEFEVGPPEEAEAMFDLLTYQKGGSVLRMLEQYLGAETFRKGIAHYLNIHRHGNTETTDLWDAIEETSGEPVRQIMDTWIFQGGHPLVSVSCDMLRTTITLRQQRFLYSGGNSGERWSVPVNLRVSTAGLVSQRRVLLDGEEVDIELEHPVDWVVANDGGWGFYRTVYSGSLLDGLLEDLQETCTPLERMTLAGDMWATVVAGEASLSDWVGLVTRLGAEEDPDVWSAVLAPLSLLDLIAVDGDREVLQSFVRTVAGPALARVGWEPKPDEPSRNGQLRSRLIAALGTLGQDDTVAAEAASRFAAFASGDHSVLAPDVVTAAMSVYVSRGGTTAFETVLDQFRAAETPQDKNRYLFALGDAEEPDLIDRGLALCLSDEVRTQDSPFLIGAYLGGRASSVRTWEWLEEHWGVIEARLPGNLLNRIFEGITSIIDPEVAARVHAWLDTHELPGHEMRIAQLTERMDINVALAGRLGGHLADDLRGHTSA